MAQAAEKSLVEKYVRRASVEGVGFLEHIAGLTGPSYATARASAREALESLRTLSEPELEKLRERQRHDDSMIRRTSRWRIATIADFPIFLHPSVILWLFILFSRVKPDGSFAAATLFTATLLLSIILHEFAHAVTCRKLGLGTGTITLWAFGGYFIPTSIDRLPFQLERSQRLRYAAMCVAGPLSNVALAGLLALAAAATGSTTLDTLAGLNLTLAALNLMPIPQLDGGSMLLSLSSLYIDWRLLYRILGGLCLIVAGVDLWRTIAITHVASDYGGLFVVGGVSALIFSFRSEAQLIEKMQKFLSAERLLVQREAEAAR